jgi:hypothetical protein
MRVAVLGAGAMGAIFGSAFRRVGAEVVFFDKVGWALSRRRWDCGSSDGPVAKGMKKISYSGYRFPPEIIHQTIWLYFRFTLSFRDVEDLLAERGIVVSYETIRR